jgi:hypothetical protein
MVVVLPLRFTTQWSRRPTAHALAQFLAQWLLAASHRERYVKQKICWI